MAVLGILQSKLNLNKYDWAITGGCNLYIRNIISNTNDIDIISSKKGSYEIQKKMCAYMIKNVEYSTHANIRSFFGQADAHGCHIDIMGDPENLIGGMWFPNKKWHNNIEYIVSGKLSLPCISLEYELKINKIIGNRYRSSEIEKYNLQNKRIDILYKTIA